MNKMEGNAALGRVLHVITRLANGGAAENTIYSVNGLVERGWEVDLAIGGHPNRDEEDQVEKLAISPKVTVRRIPELVRDPGLRELWALSALRHLIREGRYRIVHTHGAKAGVLGRVAGHKEGVPILINGIHGHTFSPQMNALARGVYRTIERRVARYTTHFVSVGDDLRRQYLAAGVGEPQRYSVIHSGMDFARFSAAGLVDSTQRDSIRAELGIPRDACVFTNVSRMEPRKGHHFFLEAASRVMRGKTEGNPWFVIVGDGPEEQNLKDQARGLGIESRVIFTGYRRDVERMFAMTDVVVLSSLWEGLPRVLVQAAAARRPAVSFACDGAGEVIRDGSNGWVVPMRDVERLAVRMSDLLHDPLRARKMGEKGAELVNDSWSVDAMVDSLSTLYQDLSHAVQV